MYRLITMSNHGMQPGDIIYVNSDAKTILQRMRNWLLQPVAARLHWNWLAKKCNGHVIRSTHGCCRLEVD